MIKKIIYSSALLSLALVLTPYQAGAASTIYQVENTSAFYLNAIKPFSGNSAFGQRPDMDLDIDRNVALELSEMSGTGAEFRQRYSDNAARGLDTDPPGMAVGLRMRYSFD